MTISSDRADSPFVSRVIYLANMACAVCGGLSLVLAVAAPLNMTTTIWGSSADAIAVAFVRGGLPFLCAFSIVLSRWVFRTGAGAIAVAIAGAPLFLAVALLMLVMAGGMPSFTDAVFGLGTKGSRSNANGDAAATRMDLRPACSIATDLATNAVQCSHGRLKSRA